MKKVFIGVGHGGADPGALRGTKKEKDMTLEVALALDAELMRTWSNNKNVEIQR